MTVKYLGKVLISEISKMISHAEEGNYVIHNICILLYSNGNRYMPIYRHTYVYIIHTTLPID